MSDRSWKATLRRWFTENVADTRLPSGPGGRLYAAPFARVWDALLDHAGRRPRWEVAHHDEELGLMTIRCRSPVLRFVDDLSLWVSLDEDGLTRVEARSASRLGRGDLGVNRRRIVRLLRSLDRAVGPEARLRERRRERRCPTHRPARRSGPPGAPAPGTA